MGLTIKYTNNMFTGIIESVGKVVSIRDEGTNRTFRFRVALDEEPIKVDQSIAHNGVCLTVTKVFEDAEGNKEYEMDAVQETLEKTSLGELNVGDPINVERCLKAGQRLDGHFVQGHVDTVGRVTEIETRDGSWMYRFAFPDRYASLLVDKGSITINGVSLTVVDAGRDSFSVTIIPYTFDHTNFHHLKVGDAVNLEFDVLGKYILRMQDLQAHQE